LDTLGVSEVHWNQFGEINTAGGKTFIFSGRGGENDEHKEGVGILMTKALRKSLTEWHPVSERILIARFRTSIRNISVIQCYAPTEGGAEEQGENFYSQLNKVLSEKTRKWNIVILMGDMNAKVGTENEGLEHIMGKHGLGNQNRNWAFFVICVLERIWSLVEHSFLIKTDI
jgi:exonuclease III